MRENMAKGALAIRDLAAITGKQPQEVLDDIRKAKLVSETTYFQLKSALEESEANTVLNGSLVPVTIVVKDGYVHLRQNNPADQREDNVVFGVPGLQELQTWIERHLELCRLAS